mmetsp:Transcript_2940/g.8966  ORF Transcript_2940/g.8966 Transcript_2940/m.8966 type:complete len:351 (+) Transcript_2940:1-1053(+)
MLLRNIWMRDPYLLSVRDVIDAADGTSRGLPVGTEGPTKLAGRYWLYGTTDKAPNSVPPYSEFPGVGLDCYCSNDLVNWNGPFPAFRKPDGFWADTQFWAPEVYLYNGRLIMFASMKKIGKNNFRGVAILESKSGRPEGPFVPLMPGPLTPPTWSCLDGTLYVENGVPYMVFCHEWTQVGDGRMCLMELSRALDSSKKPSVLFTASQAPWSKTFNSSSATHTSNFITDGPFLHRCATSNELIMLWSSIGPNDQYCVGIARSTSGSVHGPWVHDPDPLYGRDGGHAMMTKVSLERSFAKPNGASQPEHTLMLMALHAPNRRIRNSAPKLLGMLEQRDESTGLAKLDWFEFQ